SSHKLVLLHSTPLNSKLDIAQGKTQARLSSLQKIIHQHLATIQLHTDGQRATTRIPSEICVEKAQTPNFSEKYTIAKFIEGLLPSQLASHLDREPPRSLSELYAEVEKYKKSEAD